MKFVFDLAMLLLNLMVLAIFARAILSWFMPVGRDRWTRLLVDVTEPILSPIRSLLSRILPIPIDLSPIVAYFLIVLLKSLLTRAYIG